MTEKCPVYLGNNCVLKSLFTKQFNSNIFGVDLKQIDEKYHSNCEGLISKCSFNTEEAVQEEHKEEPQQQEVVEEVPATAPIIVAEESASNALPLSFNSPFSSVENKRFSPISASLFLFKYPMM